MLHLSKHEIRQSYKCIKRLAKKSVDEGDYEKAYSYINHCVTLAQQFNWIYADFELEDFIKLIAEKTLPCPPNNYETHEDRVVFYDDFCTSFILAVQYIRAILSMGKRILYITTRNIEQKSKFSTIIPLLSHEDNISVIQIVEKNSIEKQKKILEKIIDFHSSKVILHIKANSEIVPVLSRLPKPITKYIINLADQTFWLGAKVVDYVLEFRQFGVSVSQQKRGISPEQQLLLPFYPYAENISFQGFPRECYYPNRVIIFSGGDIYKVLDKGKKYWQLVKTILNRHPNVIFLFATKVNTTGTQYIENFIKANHFEGRFIYISYRQDINEVFKHSDIYMGTCPVSGSLMSQLAAINEIPILQYYYPGTPDDETEQVLCYNKQYNISFKSEKTFLDEADKLITNIEYRKSQARKLKDSMISEQQFNENFVFAMNNNVSPNKLIEDNIDYDLLDKRWYELEKFGYINTLGYLFGIIKEERKIALFPTLALKKEINTAICIIRKSISKE